MKVLILENKTEYDIQIYGIDGTEKTIEFFQTYFIGVPTVGIYETTSEERELYHTTALITFLTVHDYNCFVRVINVIQDGIDAVSDALDEGQDIDDYTFNGESYII